MILLILLAILPLSFVHGARASIEIPLVSSYAAAPEPLTTEMAWTLDPGEPNPHRARWILQRTVDLIGLGAVKSGPKFQVKLNQLESKTLAYLRATGPWYRDISEFPCASATPQFATEAGARVAADAAGKLWDELLSRDKIRLAVVLRHLSAENALQATFDAKGLFLDWLDSLNEEYHSRIEPEAHRLEWKFYEEQAKKAKVCPRKAGKSALPGWAEMMEPPAAAGPDRKLLARAPARLWSGEFSVRVGLEIGGRELNGQFLIDTSSKTSIVSSAFLLNQGVIPAWIEVGRTPFEHQRKGTGRLGRHVEVDSMIVSGLEVPMHDFVLGDTDFFEPPDYFAPCCDGVLGTDFLHLYGVEFLPAGPFEVRIWPREGFSMDSTFDWFETHLESAGEPVSSCTSGPEKWEGVYWDTGNEAAVEVHKPWIPFAKELPSKWNLVCGDQEIARDLVPSFTETAASEKYPAASVGMPVLDRGRFALDLGHGRIWLAKSTLGQPIPANRSGLSVKFEFKNDERILRVVGIRDGTPAARLKKSGVVVGTQILQVDSKPVDDLDLWEVNRHLSGDYAEEVTLLWHTRAGQKMAPLKVR